MSFQEVFAKRNNKPRPVLIAGYPCLVRRESMAVWAATGQIPQDLAELLAKYAPQMTQEENDALQGVDPAEISQAYRKLQILKIELCITGDDGTQFTFGEEPGKVRIRDLEDPDRFVKEALEALKAQPVQLADGEVSADALGTFHQDGTGQAQPAGAGVHGEDLLNAPVRAHRPARSRRGA